MLAFSLFLSIFSTLLWLIYSVLYIGGALGSAKFSSLGMVDLLTYVMIIVFPIFVLWTVFGYISQFLTNKNTASNLLTLFKQMKKNQDYTDLIARIMLEAEQSIKDGFVLNKFDIFISDMNELLSEIIYRCNLSSNEQIENLWKKTNNGGKWAFGKVIVEINSTQPTFPVRVLERSKVDKVLAGTILEFCARYLSLIALLEKHDRERVFLNIIETGIFGKVFSILAPLSDEVKRTREYNPPRPQAEDPRPLSVFPPALELGAEKEPLAAKLNPFKKKPPEEPHLEEPVDKDPFSLALEKSFGPSVSVEPKEEPLLSVSVEQTKVEERIEPGFSNTQQALDNLKKEWEEIKAFGPEKEEPKAEAPAPKAQEIVEESLSYPFAGWTNEENYKK